MAVLHGNHAFSILVLSTNGTVRHFFETRFRHPSLLLRQSIENDDLMISNDCLIKTCRFLKRIANLKISCTAL